MSGHSKWANIKQRKGAMDAKRSQVFTQISKLIKAAVKEGGSGDPKFNPSLRTLLDKARAANMPKEKVQKAIDRGLGKTAEGVVIQEITYECFGPGGVPMIISVVTDNNQRTASNIRATLTRAGGSLAGPGSAMYMFERSDNGDFVATMPLVLQDHAIIAKLEELVDTLREEDDVEDVFIAAAWSGQDEPATD